MQVVDAVSIGSAGKTVCRDVDTGWHLSVMHERDLGPYVIGQGQQLFIVSVDALALKGFERALVEETHAGRGSGCRGGLRCVKGGVTTPPHTDSTLSQPETVRWLVDRSISDVTDAEPLDLEVSEARARGLQGLDEAGQPVGVHPSFGIDER